MTVSRARIEKSANAFRSIGEVAAELGLETHVVRYWESKFPRDVRPVKRGDGRRMFRPQDLNALRAIQILVHEKGLTLKGAKALLAEQGVSAVLTGEASIGGVVAVSPARELQEKVAQAFDSELPEPAAGDRRERLQDALGELTGLKARLDAVRQKRAA